MTLHASSIRRRNPVPPGPAPGAKGKCACGTGGPCTACAGKTSSAEMARAQAELASQAGDLTMGALFPQSAPTGTEPLDRDFTALRVHPRENGDGSTANVSALGFALGSRVASDPSRSPRSSGGRNLLAHDLANVIHRSVAPGHSHGEAGGTEHSPIPIRAGGTAGGAGPLQVSNPADAAEREADRIAGSLFPTAGASAPPASEGSAFLRPAKNRGNAAGRPQASKGPFGSLAGEGRPLPDRTRQEMELALGRDLSSVRVHADSNADTLSQSLEARAFTHGSDIFFRSGQFDPESAAGKQLLAHELVHTVQQQSGLMLSRDGERRTTLQCLNENLSSAGVASWLLAIVGTTCGLIGMLAGSPTGPGAAATAAGAAAVCIAGVVGFSVGFVLGILTGCMEDPNFRSAAANAR